MTRRTRRLGVALLVVALLLGGAVVAVLSTTDRSYLSRVLAWRGADIGDVARFPVRPVRTGPGTSRLAPAPAEPPEWLRTVTSYQGGATPSSPRDPWATPAAQSGGTPVRSPLEEFLDDTGTTAFLVLRDDALLYERYAHGVTRETPQPSFSTAKSYVSALVGIAIAEGRIHGLDDPVVRYLPELAGRGMDTITVRHLLTMSSGLAFSGEDGAGGPFGDDAKIYYTPQLRRLALDVRPAGPPGERWQYNDYDTVLLGMVLERTAGRSLADQLSDKIWRPLGMEADASWSLDGVDDGFEKTASGLNARPVDVARFGRLYLDGGRRDGRQIVPESWVRESTRIDTTTDPADFYQYFWWVDVAAPGRFMAVGNLGQFVYVVPDKRLVIVRFGESFGTDGWVPLLRSIADAAP